nr:CD63 antigen-like [Leptinotarsa decemlineata]
MDCASFLRSYSRYMLILFNLIFAITGIIIICVALSAKAYFHEFDTLMENKVFYVSDLLIVVGVIIFFVSFFGCCGAMKENACMTTTYSALLIVIFLLELAVGISGVLLKNRTEEFLKDKLNETIQDYGPQNNETTELWDTIQRQFHCCGIDNATDWVKFKKDDNHLVPLSCCDIPYGAFKYNCTIEKAYPEGCLMRFGDFVNDNISAIEGVGIGFAIVQLLGIIFACVLSKFIRSDYETV